MRNRKFAEEEVVVEETTTETTEESTPDSHDAFVTILVEMGLSAEQAEAIHQMSMDLLEAGTGETTEEVSTETTEKVEASRQRRGRRNLSRKPSQARNSGSRRRGLSEDSREARMVSRLRRQNIELRKQLREFGASPASKPLRNAPQTEEAATKTTPLTGVTNQAFEMIKNLQK